MSIFPTSGTVSATRFSQRKVIDHAARRAGLMPEQMSSEQLEIAQDLIFTLTSQWINAGFPLWTREFLLLGATAGSPNVACPVGTVDIFHSFWRIFNPWRGPAQDQFGNDQSILFAGHPNQDVVIAGPAPFVEVNFNGPMEIDTVGILLGGFGGAPFLTDGYGNDITDGYGNAISAGSGTAIPITNTPYLTVSRDGVTWFPGQTLKTTTFIPGQWSYFTLDPSIVTPFMRVVWPGAGSWTINQLNFGLANGQDIEIGPLNIDDYYNLPDKQFRSNQPNSSYVDRKLVQPIIKIWPVLNEEGFYRGTVSALVRRYIQDPGALTNNVEVPQRWLEALIWRLANLLIYEIPDQDQSAQASYFTLMAKQNRIQNIGQEASKAESLAWSEERTRAPIKLAPNISVYTR